MLNGVETVWTLRSSNIHLTSVQLLLNECWWNVETIWTGLKGSFARATFVRFHYNFSRARLRLQIAGVNQLWFQHSIAIRFLWNPANLHPLSNVHVQNSCNIAAMNVAQIAACFHRRFKPATRMSATKVPMTSRHLETTWGEPRAFVGSKSLSRH